MSRLLGGLVSVGVALAVSRAGAQSEDGAAAPLAITSDAGGAPEASVVDTSSPTPGPPADAADAGASPHDAGQAVDNIRAATSEQDLTWDLNLEGGLGAGIRDPAKFLAFGRVRAGALLINAPSFMYLGATYEVCNKSLATLGLQFEYMHLMSGLWLQVGALFDAQYPRPGLSVALGWSIVGAELQQRAYEGLGPTTALYFKARLPLGFIFWALKHRQGSAMKAEAPGSLWDF